MARRKRRRHARENPLSDTTKIVLAVGATAAVVGVGYYLYKRNQSATAGAQQFAPQLGVDATRGTPPPGANAGGSSSTDAQRQQQQQLQLQSFKLGDKTDPNNTNTSDPDPGTSPALYQKALGAAQVKFASLWAGGEVYAFQMAIGAVQALKVRPQDVIGIATDAVQAYWLQQGVPLAKAKAFATATRDGAGFGPKGAAGGYAYGSSGGSAPPPGGDGPDLQFR